MYFTYQNHTSSLQYKTNTCMNSNSVYRISLCDLNFNVIFFLKWNSILFLILLRGRGHEVDFLLSIINQYSLSVVKCSK